MSMPKIRMPVLFVGHGSPMNALEDNEYSKSLRSLGRRLPRPRAILSISAHWLTRQVSVTHMATPKTIHDFYGFPKELSEIQYPAPGSPQLGEEIAKILSGISMVFDETEWGLDHGTWAVLKHLFPKADVPVVQLGIAIQEPPQFHLDLGKKLGILRDQGILILGSGNIVHNLRQICWEPDAKPFDWAIEFDQLVKEALVKGDETTLLAAPGLGPAGRLSVPTPEHYYPLHYIVGAAWEEGRLEFVYEEIQNGSIAMRSLVYW